MNIKLVVFDIAGTTLKDDGSIANAFSEALRDFGYEVQRERISALMGYRKIEAIRMMLDEHVHPGASPSIELLHSINDRFVQIMKDYYSGAKLVSLGAEKVFAQLQRSGIHVGINTGFPKEVAEIILQRTRWLQNRLVNVWIASDEVPEGRPHPHMLRKLMAESSISNPLAVIKVGDTAVDIAEGKNAGCRYSIAVTTGSYTREQLLTENADYVLDHLSELVPIIDHTNS